jgi:hypothetical protein
MAIKPTKATRKKASAKCAISRRAKIHEVVRRRKKSLRHFYQRNVDADNQEQAQQAESPNGR